MQPAAEPGHGLAGTAIAFPVGRVKPTTDLVKQERRELNKEDRRFSRGEENPSTILHQDWISLPFTPVPHVLFVDMIYAYLS
jgi:hypothetical protein